MPTIKILLAFSDYGRDHSLHLRGLNQELEAILSIMKEVEDCEIVPILDANIEKIVDAFTSTSIPIVGFHYAGHGNGYELALQESVQGEKFAQFLGKQEALQWVFLNSCASSQHAQHLILQGINAVITTSRGIKDEEALSFAQHFYQQLAQCSSLSDAFDHYPGLITLKKEAGPPVYRDRVTTDHFGLDALWELHIRPGAEQVKDWNLAQAIGNPLLGLPSIPIQHQLPNHPFRSLERFDRSHAELFFGRGEEIASLYKFISADSLHSPLLLLFGQTGVGKSSLLEAGLFPRLEQNYSVHYLRRTQSIGLPGMLKHALGSPESNLRERWKDLEEQNGQPLVLIFDQVEECYTKARPEGEAELNQFLQQISSIFLRPKEGPKGKVVLSFRKEFLAEIQGLAHAQQISYQLLCLKALNRKGIQEAIEGITRTPRLQAKYQLDLEPSLSGTIADRLLEDVGSSVAPVLQILLTKLWNLAFAENPLRPQFTLETFQNVRREGILLEDFVEEKFQEIQLWNPHLEQSGLLLDLLMFHITELGTAGQRTLREIKERYSHQSELLDPLIREVCDTYLLIETDGSSIHEDKSLRLIHDCMGPVLRKAFDQSQRDGQVATRILKSNALASLENDEPVYLNENTLMLVEKGREGMRKWTKKEEQLIQESQILVQKQKRLRLQLRWGGIAAALILLVTLSGLLWQSAHKNSLLTAQALNLRADSLLAIDPTKSLTYLQEAYQQNSSPEYQSKYLKIFRENISYQVLVELPHGIRSVAFSPNQKRVAIAAGNNIYLYDLRFPKLEEPIKILETGDKVPFLFFVNEHQVFAFDLSRHVYLFDLQLDERMYATLDDDLTKVFPIAKTQPEITFQLDKQAGILQWNWEKNTLKTLTDSSFLPIDPIWSAGTKPFARTKTIIAQTGMGENTIEVADPLAFWDSPNPLKGHLGRIQTLSLLEMDSKTLLVSSSNRDNRLLCWTISGLPYDVRPVPEYIDGIWPYGGKWLLYKGGMLGVWDKELTRLLQQENCLEDDLSALTVIGERIFFCDNEFLYAWEPNTDHSTCKWAVPLNQSISFLSVVQEKLWGYDESDSLVAGWNLETGDTLNIFSENPRVPYDQPLFDHDFFYYSTDLPQPLGSIEYTSNPSQRSLAFFSSQDFNTTPYAVWKPKQRLSTIMLESGQIALYSSAVDYLSFFHYPSTPSPFP